MHMRTKIKEGFVGGVVGERDGREGCGSLGGSAVGIQGREEQIVMKSSPEQPFKGGHKRLGRVKRAHLGRNMITR